MIISNQLKLDTNWSKSSSNEVQLKKMKLFYNCTQVYNKNNTIAPYGMVELVE